MGELNIDFKPNHVQKQFIESRAKADLFSSRVGEGKSAGLAWSVFYHTRHNPGANWVILRDTFGNVQRSTQKEFFKWFPPGIMGDYHSTNKTFTWREGIASGTVTFMGMDDPTDASKLLSWELAGVAMDEPAPAAGSAGIDEMVFDLALTRLRQPGMNWYAMKLATNNPDESHWTYTKFVTPGMEGFMLWQPSIPENVDNLPPGYYEGIRATLAHRPDLVRRFVDGEFGFQSEGKAVTPQWSDKIHLANGLVPIKNTQLELCWDFGLNPTCIITQRTPQGFWLILDSMVGDGYGAEELIADQVKPLLASERYERLTRFRHIGDPAGNIREQSSAYRTAVASLRRELGGQWRNGPVRLRERIDPLQIALSKTIGGTGLVQVDRIRASAVWYALRGGWHYNVARSGVVSTEPKKNIHSHPGDAMGYGAAVLFPQGRLEKRDAITMPETGGYFGGRTTSQGFRIGKNYELTEIPKHGHVLPK